MKKMRVLYNPYSKQFGFRYMPDGRTCQDIAVGSSGLAKYMYRELSLQNCLPDVFDDIKAGYGSDFEGIDVEFCGTASNYDDFCAVLKNNAHKPDKLHLAGLHYELISSSEALETIKCAYERIKSEFPDTGSDATEKTKTIASIVEKYNNATKSELNLVVVGTYSSGKSTFINALIGEELLPRGEDPTTGRISKITAGDEYSIRFDVLLGTEEKAETIEMRWTNGNFCFEYRPGPEQISDLLARIGNYAEQRRLEKGGESPVAQMNAVIGCFNDFFDEKVKIDPLLRVTLPFHIGSIASGERVVNIFDTPGSDAATAPQHMDTLKDALGRQTNALPILLVKRNDMVKTGNEALKKMIEGYSANMDLANKLVVVTHGDEISLNDLRAGIKTDVLDEWRFNKILFLSSIAALGTKKNGELSDGTYAEKYNNCKSVFHPGGEYYRRLYEYAVLPDEKGKEALRCAAADADGDSLRHDCGMFSVEYEVQLYADKFLQYLKAHQRCEYLRKALTAAEKQLDEEKNAQAVVKEVDVEARKEKAKNLTDTLRKFVMQDADYIRIADGVKDEYLLSMTEFVQSFHTYAKETWRGRTNKFGSLFKKSSQKDFAEKMETHCKSYVISNYLDIKASIKRRYLKLAENTTSKLATIIQADSDLTDEAKRNLLRLLVSTTKTPEFSTEKSPDFKNKNAFGNFIFIHWVNPGKYAEALKTTFWTFVSDKCVMEPYEDFKEQFGEWLKKTKADFTAKLDSKSVALREFDERIKKSTAEIDGMSRRLENLSAVKQELECLLVFPKEARE